MHDVPSPAITVSELTQWMDQGRDFVLLDTLPHDHFAAVHLPGAKNACLYETTFADQVASVLADTAATATGRPIVVYGPDNASRNADVAAAKLARLGHAGIHRLEGGLAAWRAAGLPLHGAAPDTIEPEPPVLPLADRTYLADSHDSVLEWTGRNAHSAHTGTVRLARGLISRSGDIIAGQFEIDMRTIANTDLHDADLRTQLVNHLLSDDFFLVEQFPYAMLSIISARPKVDATIGAPNLEIAAVLAMAGVNARIQFEATITPLDEGRLAMEAHLDIDRTRWQVIYGSGRFFRHLGRHLVFDTISIATRMVLTPVSSEYSIITDIPIPYCACA
ncbi:MAG: YceI family protein [Desulfovibrionaceae bacterium]